MGVTFAPASTRAAGRPSVNLDLFMMCPAHVQALFARHTLVGGLLGQRRDGRRAGVGAVGALGDGSSLMGRVWGLVAALSIFSQS